MSIENKRMITTVLSLFVLVIASVLPGHAEQRYDEHDDPVAYAAIRSSGVLDEQYVHQDGTKRVVIIDDRSYLLDPECIFRNRLGRLVPLARFQPGMEVRFYVVHPSYVAGHRTTFDQPTITKLWHSPSETTDDDRDISPSAGGGSRGEDNTLRYEDGVWKN